MNKKRNKIVIFSFFILSMLIIFPFIQTGNLKVINDGVFHLQRINEIYENLKEGHITYIATHTFSKIGLASFEFYPSLFLYPWAFLRFIFAPITAFYVGWGILLFITLTVAYLVMMNFSKGNFIRSIAFALLYALSGKYITEFARFQLGELIAYTFLPIVFLGFYKIIFDNDRKGIFSLAIGLALIAYSHVLTTYICILLMTVIFIIMMLKKSINYNKCISITKSAFLFMLLVIWQYVPFVSNHMNNTVATPQFSFYPMQVNDFWNESWMNNIMSDSSIGILLIIVLSFGWVIVDSKREKWIYVLGLALCIGATTLLPWGLFSKTVLIKILMPLQFSFRFLPLAVLFLSITGSLMIERIIQKSNLYIPILLIILFGSYFNSINPLMKDVTKNNIAYLSDKQSSTSILPFEVYINNYTYNNINKYIAPIGSLDYISKKALTNNNYKGIQKHNAFIGGKKTNLNPKSEPNKLIFYCNGKKDEIVNLPAINYGRTMVKINGKQVKSRMSFRGTVEVTIENSGSQKIEVSYKPSLLFYILLMLAILSWIIIIIDYSKEKDLY